MSRSPEIAFVVAGCQFFATLDTGSVVSIWPKECLEPLEAKKAYRLKQLPHTIKLRGASGTVINFSQKVQLSLSFDSKFPPIQHSFLLATEGFSFAKILMGCDIFMAHSIVLSFLTREVIFSTYTVPFVNQRTDEPKIASIESCQAASNSRDAGPSSSCGCHACVTGQSSTSSDTEQYERRPRRQKRRKRRPLQLPTHAGLDSESSDNQPSSSNLVVASSSNLAVLRAGAVSAKPRVRFAVPLAGSNGLLTEDPSADNVGSAGNVTTQSELETDTQTFMLTARKTVLPSLCTVEVPFTINNRSRAVTKVGYATQAMLHNLLLFEPQWLLLPEANVLFLRVTNLATYPYTLQKKLPLIMIKNPSSALTQSLHTSAFISLLQPEDKEQSVATEEDVELQKQQILAAKQPPQALSQVEVEALVGTKLEHLTPDDRDSAFHAIRPYLTPVVETDFCKAIKIRVPTLHNEPIFQRQYKLNYIDEDLARQHIEKLVKQGILVPCNSRYNFPYFLVRKKGADPKDFEASRLVYNFIKLNQVIPQDQVLLPTVEQIVLRLRGAVYLTKLDLTAAYYSLMIDEEDQHKLSITSTEGQRLCFTRLCFGLNLAPEVFNRVLNMLLFDQKSTFYFFDDIVIRSEAHEGVASHMRQVGIIIRKLRSNGFVINFKKSDFVKKELSFLGFLISGEYIKIDPSKLKFLDTIKIPKTTKQLQALLGWYNFFRNFVYDFAAIVTPLVLLLRKNVAFDWSAECDDAVAKLNACLLQQIALTIPDLTKPFFVFCDASSTAISGVLLQAAQDGQLVPCQFYSATLEESRKNYSIEKLELYAILRACRHFRRFLQPNRFVLYSDNKNVVRLLRSKLDPSALEARWIQELLRFNFEVRWIATKSNIADYLTRPPFQAPLISDTDFSDDVAIITQEPDLQYLPILDRHVLLDRQETDAACVLIKKLREGKIQVTDQPPASMSEEYHKTILDFYRHYKNDFDMDGDLLVIKATATHLGNETPTMYAVLPKGLYFWIFQAYHSAPFSAHRSVTKANEMIFKLYRGPGLADAIKFFTEKCGTCLRSKALPKPVQLPLTHAHRPDQPLQTISIDFTGPFMSPRKQPCFLLTILDIHSHFLFAYITSDETAKSAAVALQKYFLAFGFSRQILSDRGSAFVSRLMRELCAYFGIKQIMTTAYRPSGSLVERLHSSLSKGLRCQLDACMGRFNFAFEDLLRLTIYAMNTTIHSTMKVCPQELFFKREVNYPHSVPLFLGKYETTRTDFAQAWNWIQAKIKERNDYEDRTRRICRPFSITVGEQVLIRREKPDPRLGSHLSSKYLPTPHLVYKVLSDAVVAVRNQTNGKEFLVNVHRLRPYSVDDHSELLKDDPLFQGSSTTQARPETPLQQEEESPPSPYLPPRSTRGIPPKRLGIDSE